MANQQNPHDPADAPRPSDHEQHDAARDFTDDEWLDLLAPDEEEPVPEPGDFFLDDLDQFDESL